MFTFKMLYDNFFVLFHQMLTNAMIRHTCVLTMRLASIYQEIMIASALLDLLETGSRVLVS